MDTFPQDGGMRLIRLLKHDLARETGEWVDDGVISEAQAELICARYEVDYHRARERSLGYNVLVGLGYLFIALALITLIGANWDEIPRALRMGGLIALTVATQCVALRIYLKRDPRAGEGLFLLGNFFFGASIILISQIYHLGEHMPDGLLWWALGCLPFALITRSPWIALQANVLALLWFFLQVRMGYYPVLFPLFILVSLFVLLRGRVNALLLLVLLGSIGLWIEYSLAEVWRVQEDGFKLALQVESLAVAISLFVLLYIFAHWLALKQSSVARDYAAVVSVWCLRFALISLLVFSFESPWESLIEADWDHLWSMWLVVVVMAVITLVLAMPTRRLLSTGIFLVLFAGALAFVSTSNNQGLAVYLQVATNFALIGSGIWLIYRGIHDGISHYFFLGVMAVLLTALLRYIDLIGDYLGAALIFILFAGLLLGAAKYWKFHQGREGTR
ncbi:membrane protein [Microbulbifer sp. GL-2]|nr:membrane protein [Microbulbifer sp. GL-2]